MLCEVRTYITACSCVILDDWSIVDRHVMLTDSEVCTVMLIQLNHQLVVLQFQFLQN